MVKNSLSVASCIVALAVASVWAMSNDDLEKAYNDSYILEKSQKYDIAMQMLYPVLKEYENGYTVNYRLGWLSYLNGNFADALRYYRKSLAIYPASIEVMNCVSLVHKARVEWGLVEEENSKILKIDFYNQTANYWYAYALKVQKKYDLAEKVSRKMLTIIPTSTIFLYELGDVLYLKGSRTDALEIFRSVKLLDPFNAYAKKYIDVIEKELNTEH